jgi:hypothetical protein
MSTNTPLPVLAIYHVKKGTEPQFLNLLSKHWPTLNQLGLVTQTPPVVYKTEDRHNPGKVSFVEIFEWKNSEAPDVAHQSPEVMQTWEAMGPSLEKLDIMHLEPLKV